MRKKIEGEGIENKKIRRLARHTYGGLEDGPSAGGKEGDVRAELLGRKHTLVLF